jgi:hypothetical protein
MAALAENPDTTETPAYLVPTQQFVQNSCSELAQLVYRTADKEDILKATDTVSMLLEGLSYDGIKVTATDLQKKLNPLTSQQLGYRVDEPVKRFIADLEYVAIFEKGGLESINRYLTETIQQAQQLTDPEKQKPLLRKLNDLLSRSLYLFPHVARGVRLEVTPESLGRSEQFTQDFGYDYGRHRYPQYLELYSQVYGKQPDEPNVFVVPLPYWFSSVASHGSGAREAHGASSETIQFRTIHRRNDRTPVSTIAISLEKPISALEHTHFLLEEIKALTLTDSSVYTPWFDYSNNELTDRGSYFWYYMNFRDFHSYSNFRERTQLKITDEEWAEVQHNLLEPKPYTNLWRFGNSTIERLAFILKGEKEDETTLFNLHNIQQKVSDAHVTAAALCVSILRGNIQEGDNLQIVKGKEDIIRHLAGIPVQMRTY